MRFCILTLLALFMLATFPAVAFADDTENDLYPEVSEHTETLQEEDAANSYSAYMIELKEKTDIVVKGLDDNELRVLYYIRQSFGTTRGVRTVLDLVSNTVSLCGDKNPELKSDMDERLNIWRGSVETALTNSEARMKQAIDKQKFRKPDDIRDYLDVIEKIADFTDAQIEKIPVTTADACNGLLDSMNETGAHLVKLVGALEIPADIINQSAGNEESSTKEETK